MIENTKTYNGVLLQACLDGYQQGRADAIDEFVKAISTETEWRTESTAWNDVVRIAEMLKKGVNNG